MTDESRLPVKVLRGVRIAMPDGVHLSASLYMPEREGQYPGLLTFFPYFKYGGIEQPRHFASRGYVVVQADFRGTGGSEGTNPYPMDPQEREDGHHLVEWIAAQPWCTGDVGMFGSSYGGITSLSTASTRPPHLKAIVPIHATYDNYEHYMTHNGWPAMYWIGWNWGPRMAGSNLMPPGESDPDGRWLRVWRERLEGNTPWMLAWHGAAPDREFWQRRRIPYERIEVPSFFISGWRDIYPGPMLKMFAAVDAPRRILIGPWKHAFPDIAPVGRVGGLAEMDRWWDRWLKGIRNGVEDDPPIALHVQGTGEWRYEREWPPARGTTARYFLGPDRALAPGTAPPEPGDDAYAYDSRVGTGSITYYGHSGGLAFEGQGQDDLLSLTYTTAPLAADLELAGAPRVRVHISSTTGRHLLVAKLCAVDRDGRSTVITQGWRDVSRASAHDRPQPLAPDEVRELAVEMNPTSYLVRAGQRLRLSLSGGDFPELWPSAHPYEMRLHRGADHASYLDLPIVAAGPPPAGRPQFAPPATDLASSDALGGHTTYTIRRQLGGRTIAVDVDWTVENRVDAASTLAFQQRGTLETDADRPWLSSMRATTRWELKRPVGWVETRVETVVTLGDVRLEADVAVDGKPFFRRSWAKEIEPP